MAQILAKVLKNIRMMHRAGLTACPQDWRMTSVGVASGSAQHGTTEYHSVAALPCHQWVNLKDCHGTPCWSAWLWSLVVELE